MNKHVLILLVSVAGGVAAWFLVAQYRAEADVPVLIAKQATPRYAGLKNYETMFELQRLGPQALPQGFRNAVTPEQLKQLAKDHLIEKALKAGEPLSLDYLIDKNRYGLGAGVRKGCTAFAVRASADTAVAGFIQPDNFVQVLGTRRLNNNEKKAILLMQRIRVLAVDQAPDRSPDQVAKVASTITLEVTMDEAKVLKVAQEDGPLSLVLMSFRDADPDPDKAKELLDRELTAEELVARRGERSEGPRPQPPAGVLVARRALAKGASPAEVRDGCELRQDVAPERLASRPATELAQLEAVPRESRLQRALQIGDCLSLDDFFEKGSKRPQLTTIIDGTGSRTYTWDELTGNPTLLETVPLEPVHQPAATPAATKEVIKTPTPQQ